MWWEQLWVSSCHTKRFPECHCSLIGIYLKWGLKRVRRKAGKLYIGSKKTKGFFRGKHASPTLSVSARVTSVLYLQLCFLGDSLPFNLHQLYRPVRRRLSRQRVINKPICEDTMECCKGVLYNMNMVTILWELSSESDSLTSQRHFANACCTGARGGNDPILKTPGTMQTSLLEYITIQNDLFAGRRWRAGTCGDQRAEVFLTCSPPLFLSQGAVSNAGLLGQQLPGSACLCYPQLG